MDLIVVGISEYKFAEIPARLITYGLGSCVAIILHCRNVGVASMAHVMLPMSFTGDKVSTPGKFADTAIVAMLKEMDSRGIGPGSLEAKLTGGADMFAGKIKGMSRRIGARNVLATRKTLGNYGVKILAQETGGNSGRTAEFHTEDGSLIVRTLREGMVVV